MPPSRRTPTARDNFARGHMGSRPTNLLRPHALSRCACCRALPLGLLLACASSLAYAQEGAAVHTFEPTAPGDRFRAVPDATVHGDLEPWVGLSWDYAYRPRGVSDRDEGRGLIGGAEIYSHLGASISLWDRLSFDLNLPTRLASTEALSDQGGFSFADLRLGSRGTLWSFDDNAMALGAGASVWLPTGSESEGTGDGQARLHLRGIVSGERQGVLYTANLGWLARKKADVGNLTVGPAVTFGAGAAFPLVPDRVHVGPEIYGQVVIPNESIDTGLSRSTPIEGLATAQVRVGSFLIGGLLGTGLTSTPGTARLRAELSIATIADFLGSAPAAPPPAPPPSPPPPPPPDRDGDGILDERDACLDTPGVVHPDPRKHGCPSDRDGDEIVDDRDACPDVSGVPSEDPTKHGCPPDVDADGIVDGEDACPEVPGVESDDPAKRGCPPDTDGDGILDGVDACPEAPGDPSEDPKKHGCPIAAIVVDEIRITQQVHFGSRSARILPESDEVLSAIAKLLRDHPEILLVSIEGHTDSRDNPYYNKQLSRWRAAAVRTWLVQRGKIKASRLVSDGFGEERPLESNETEEGMAKNRRVELHIKKRAPKDAEGGP
jgi:OmpA-OmpF porin, OOP family